MSASSTTSVSSSSTASVVDGQLFTFVNTALRAATNNLDSVIDHITTATGVKHLIDLENALGDTKVNVDHVVELQLFTSWICQGDKPAIITRPTSPTRPRSPNGTEKKKYYRPLATLDFGCIQDVFKVVKRFDTSSQA